MENGRINGILEAEASARKRICREKPVGFHVDEMHVLQDSSRVCCRVLCPTSHKVSRAFGDLTLKKFGVLCTLGASWNATFSAFFASLR